MGEQYQIIFDMDLSDTIYKFINEENKRAFVENTLLTYLSRRVAFLE